MFKYSVLLLSTILTLLWSVCFNLEVYKPMFSACWMLLFLWTFSKATPYLNINGMFNSFCNNWPLVNCYVCWSVSITKFGLRTIFSTSVVLLLKKIANSDIWFLSHSHHQLLKFAFFLELYMQCFNMFPQIIISANKLTCRYHGHKWSNHTIRLHMHILQWT